jgi:putative membrane protein
LFYLLLILLVLVVGITFSLKNPQEVAINYYFGLGWTGPMSWLLLVVLAVGSFLGVLLTSTWVLRATRRLSQAKKEARRMEQEVSNLRALPIKDDV